ncbi:hypothetical protein tb265_46740 [Gemmatimonadetes bacterium T265]|nr:hypothetical protein tb265_46740 [Gemmatimonadetes bacterium T265]
MLSIPTPATKYTEFRTAPRTAYLAGAIARHREGCAMQQPVGLRWGAYALTTTLALFNGACSDEDVLPGTGVKE